MVGTKYLSYRIFDSSSQYLISERLATGYCSQVDELDRATNRSVCPFYTKTWYYIIPGVLVQRQPFDTVAHRNLWDELFYLAYLWMHTRVYRVNKLSPRRLRCPVFCNVITFERRVLRWMNLCLLSLRWMIPPMVVHPEKIDFRRFV